MQEAEDRISDPEDTLEDTDTMVKENSKHKKTLKMKHLKSPEKYETTKSKK